MDSDFPQTVLLMLFFVSLVYDLKIFKYLFALGLCFTKETAIVLLFGIFIGDLIVSIRQDKTKGIIKKAISFVVGETHYIYAAAIFLLPMAFGDTGWSKILKGAIKSILGIKSDTVNNTPNLADKTAYKLLKLEGIFASHFSWILTIAIVLGFVFFLIKKDKKMNKELAKFLPVLTGCFVMFTLFSVFYFTYPHYRYLKSGYLMLVLFLAIAVEIADIKELIKSLSLTCMAILMAFESFHTIDPVTNAIYTKVDCGNGTAVTMTRYFFGGDYYGYGYTEEEREVSRLYLGDGFEHNLQVEAMQHLFEKAFAYIDPDSDTLIVLDPIGGELSTTTMVLFGTRRYEDYVWTNGTLDHFKDAEAVNIASGWTQEDIYEGQIDAILYRSDYARTCSLEQNSDRIYYIDMPFNDRFEDTYLNGKDILEQVTIEEGIWAIDILRVK